MKSLLRSSSHLCRRCCVKVLPKVSFVIFVRAKNKDWLKAVYGSCASSAFWCLSALGEGEDQITCVRCLVAEYYLRILRDGFESNTVLLNAYIDPHLLYFLTSTAWCMALLSSCSYMVAEVQIQPLKPSLKVSGVFIGPTLLQKCQ